MDGGGITRGGNAYAHTYTKDDHCVVDVAQYLGANHESLLKRVLAWQEAVFTDDALPGWLQDSLINVLQTRPERA